MALVWLSEWLQGPGADGYEADERIPLFRSMERCFGAIAAWHAHADASTAPPRKRSSPESAVRAAREVLAAAGDTLTERDAGRILSAYGVPAVEERRASPRSTR